LIHSPLSEIWVTGFALLWLQPAATLRSGEDYGRLFPLRLECGQFEATVLSSISSFAGSKQNQAKSAQVFELGFIPEKNQMAKAK